MKKTTFKTIASAMLLAIPLSLLILNGCKKNVSDVYEYKPVVLNPDFELLDVGYTISNDELNSASELTFKVTYKNNEVTQNTYSSVLNFSVDGVILESVPLQDIVAGTSYEKIFKWQAVAGSHAFKFDINLSSDGNKIVDETNVANNSKASSLDIAAKKLVVVQEVTVTPAVATQEIKADAKANIVSELSNEGLAIATTVEPVKTTYDNHTSAIVAAVAKNDGSIDTTKVVLAITSNPGVHSGQKQEAKTTVIVETLVDKKEVSFYNANERLSYTDGVLSFNTLKSATDVTCSEKSNLESLVLSPAAFEELRKMINDLIAQYGIKKGLEDSRKALIEVLDAYNFTQGDVDNPPVFSFEILSNPTPTENCVEGKIVKVYDFPGFKLQFKDDRNVNGVKLNGAYVLNFEKAPSPTSSNKGTYTFEDCGGNKVSFTFSNDRMTVQTNEPCVPNVHN